VPSFHTPELIEPSAARNPCPGRVRVFMMNDARLGQAPFSHFRGGGAVQRRRILGVEIIPLGWFELTVYAVTRFVGCQLIDTIANGQLVDTPQISFRSRYGLQSVKALPLFHRRRSDETRKSACHDAAQVSPAPEG
jgi:hypothetical protein